MMNAKRISKRAITAITNQNLMAAMALTYDEVNMIAAHMVDKGVMDVDENESWERQEVNAVHLVRYMGIGTEGLQKMQDEIHAENEEVVIPIQVRWLVNPDSIREKRQRGEISVSSVVLW
jgi:hypothetical protein